MVVSVIGDAMATGQLEVETLILEGVSGRDPGVVLPVADDTGMVLPNLGEQSNVQLRLPLAELETPEYSSGGRHAKPIEQ